MTSIATFFTFFSKMPIFVKNIKMNTNDIKIDLLRQIDALPENIVVELKEVVQRYLQQRTKKIVLTDIDINSVEIQTLIENSSAFDFLKSDEEDIYTDADLKFKY